MNDTAVSGCPHPRAYGFGVEHPRFPEVVCAVCGAWFIDAALVGRNALGLDDPKAKTA